MAAASIPSYRFGDLLAIARQSWIAQMAEGLAAAGYAGYRRSDAATVRLLRRGPMPVGRLGDALGITRQAARKIVTGLEQRGFAVVQRDQRDARQRNVLLTATGESYAHAIVAVIGELDWAVARRVTAGQLAAADTVLRAVLAEGHAPALAAFLPAPPGESTASSDRPGGSSGAAPAQ